MYTLVQSHATCYSHMFQVTATDNVSYLTQYNSRNFVHYGSCLLTRWNKIDK